MISKARQREVAALHKRKERAKRALYLAEGPHLLLAALVHDPTIIAYVVAAKSAMLAAFGGADATAPGGVPDEQPGSTSVLPANADASADDDADDAIDGGVDDVSSGQDARAPSHDPDSPQPRLADIDFAETAAALRRARDANIPVETAPDDLFAMKLAATVHSQGVLAVIHREQYPPVAEMFAAERMCLLVLDGVQDPGNVGTLVRSAAAFGADLVIAGPGTADVYNPKSVRASAGGVFTVPVLMTPRHRDLTTLCEASGIAMIITAPDAPAFAGFSWPTRFALVIGNEAAGISDALRAAATASIGIPQLDRVESLNAAMAGAILLAHAFASCGTGVSPEPTTIKTTSLPDGATLSSGTSTTA